MMETAQDSLTKAIWREDVEEVKALLSSGASPDQPDAKGTTPLMQAAEIESAPIVRLLLSAGADVNRQGYGGQTPLHIAVDVSIDGTIQRGGARGDEPTEIIEFLLVHGANVDARNDKWETPLDWARGYKSGKVMRLLQETNRRAAQQGAASNAPRG